MTSTVAVILGFASYAFVILSAVSYTHLRAHETVLDLVCRLLLEKNNLDKLFQDAFRAAEDRSIEISNEK